MTGGRGLLAIAILLALVSGCRSEGAPAAGVHDAETLLVTSGFTDEVLVLSAADGRILQRIPLDRRRAETDEPHGIAVAPDGRHWYVTLMHGDPTLWKFELPGNRLVGRLALGTAGAARIGLTPDGSRAFIPDYHRSGQGAPSRIAVVELEDLVAVASPLVCAAPHDAQVSADGSLVAIVCSLSDEVVILDARTLEVRSRFFVDETAGAPGEPRFKPMNVLWDPESRGVLVVLHMSDEVRLYGVDGGEVARAGVGHGPAQIAVTPDGSTLLTANRMDGSFSVVDVATMRERARVPLGVAHPHGIAVDDDGSTVFISYEGSVGGKGGVVAVDLADLAPRWRTEAGVFTLGVVHVSGR